MFEPHYHKKTVVVTLTAQQVQGAMERFVADLRQQFPDPVEQEKRASAFATVLDRKFLRDDIIPRIEGNDDINWLIANNAPITVKSSLGQFVDQHMIRLQILNEDVRKAYRDWSSH